MCLKELKERPKYEELKETVFYQYFQKINNPKLVSELINLYYNPNVDMQKHVFVPRQDMKYQFVPDAYQSDSDEWEPN